MSFSASVKQVMNYHFTWDGVKTAGADGGGIDRVPGEVRWTGDFAGRLGPRRGWYMLELELLTRKDRSAVVCLCFDCAGFAAPVEVTLSCLSGRLSKRIIWLPGAITEAAVKIIGDDIRLRSVELKLKRLLKSFSSRRMLERVAKQHSDYQGVSVQSLTGQLTKHSFFLRGLNFSRLYSLYQQTFPVAAGNSSVSTRGTSAFADLQAMLDYPQVALNPSSDTFLANNLVIHWVTCDFAPKGGGGNMTIFRFVRLLELFGHHQHIWLHNKTSHSSAATAYEDLVRNYQQTSAQVHFIADEPDAFRQSAGDIIIATDWQSVWPVLSVSGFKRRFYFVQDHEPSFFSAGAHSLAAGMTYREDLDCICAGPWLEKLMTAQYGRWATKFWLAADRSVYYPSDNWPQNNTPRIAFYARSTTSRRAVELGLLALIHLSEQGVQFHVDVYGSHSAHPLLSGTTFSRTEHGVLSADELGDLYRRCDIGMVFSATNYSLVPQEMMACRLAVLELDGDNTRTVFPDDAAMLAEPHPHHIAAQLRSLLDNVTERRDIAVRGMKWAAQFDWEKTAGDVNSEVLQRLSGLGYRKVVVKPAAEQKIKVSVVIPTFNGGDLLLKVLDAVRAQKTPWHSEVLVIDSGSTDGTFEAMQKLDFIRLHRIPQTEFNHGGTRNLGVEMTSGEYIAFLTQDALPADEFWLLHLVSALEHDSNVAGAFGKHLPYPEASPFVQRDLHAHFENLAQYPLYLSKETDRARFDSGEQGWRQILHFYSDNNSCMRRSVWEKIPYPVIDYGEDQVWADQIIKAGYRKAYAINAVVYHSHDYDETDKVKRRRIEVAFFKKYFGYEL